MGKRSRGEGVRAGAGQTTTWIWKRVGLEGRLRVGTEKGNQVGERGFVPHFLQFQNGLPPSWDPFIAVTIN